MVVRISQGCAMPGFASGINFSIPAGVLPREPLSPGRRRFTANLHFFEFWVISLSSGRGREVCIQGRRRLIRFEPIV